MPKISFVTRRARLLGGAVGLIVPGICYSEVFPVICQEISRLAQKSGLTLLFGDVSSPDPKVRAERAYELARKFTKENVSGVIYQPMERIADPSLPIRECYLKATLIARASTVRM